MGRSFFDFSQAHGGSKQNNANGLKHPRNRLDLSVETLEGHKSSDINREEKQCTYEMKKNSAAKTKSGGMPIKKLIAEEMSKGTDSKCRTPSVIARLMGLDSLPTQSLLTNQSKEEKHAQKKLSWKDQQQSKPTPDTKDFSQKANSSERKPNQFLSSTKSQQYALDNPGAERIHQAHPYLNNPDKKQQQNFKEDIGTWQTSKFQDYSRPFQPEKLNIQAVGYHMPKNEKLTEGKMALVRQKFMDAKRLATDVNLQQSKEFIDAVEMLQSNKDAFLEFLEQPNSLFSKKHNDLDTTSKHHSQLNQITILKSSNPARTYKEDNKKQRPLKKGETKEKHTRKLMGQRDLGEKNELCQKQSVPRMVSVGSIPDEHKQSTSGLKGKNSSSSVPTRIVVLKPGPVRTQNFQSGSSPSCSPQYETCIRNTKEIERARSQDYLQEVRIRLEMEISKEDKSRRFMKDVEKQVGNKAKYRREIATEIARHVRENLGRDLMNDLPSEVLSSLPDSPGNISLSRSENVHDDVDQEVYTPVSKLSWDSADRFSLGSPSISARSDSSESTVNREAKRRLLERWRSTHGNVEKEEEQQQQRVSSTLAEILSLPERKNHVLGSRSPKENDKPSEECEVLQHDELQLRSKNKKPMRPEGEAEWECSLGQKNLDGNGSVLPKNLPRSRSVPASAKTYNRGSIDMQGKALIADVRNAHDMDRDRSSNSLTTESIKSKSRKSTKGKVLSMKRHFLMRGKWSNSKKSDSLEFEPIPYLHLQSEQGLSVPMWHMARESHEQLEGTELHSSLVQQEPCELLVDAPEATTETDECSTSAASDTSGEDEDGFKQPRCESSVRDTIAVKCETGSSNLEANCLRRGISSISQSEFPSACSPIKKLPVFENPVPESNTDKGEHPSPVSVLDTTFEEEYSSPKDFKEISSNLHELRLQLRLLKSDGSERSVHRSANLLDQSNLHFKDHKIGDVATGRGNTLNTMSEAEMPCMSNSKLSSIDKLKYESLDIDDISWSDEQLPDLLYIRSVFIASGYTGDPNTIFARWHSPNYPLDPHLFDKIEDKDDMHSEMRFSETELAEVGSSNTIRAYRSKSERRILFDCINEALLEILGPFLNYHPWVRPTKMSLRPVASGKQLLKETWTRICKHLYTQPEVRYTLENLVKNDLSRESIWMELRGDVEMVGNEIEKTIFKDLIEDVLYDIVS